MGAGFLSKGAEPGRVQAVTSMSSGYRERERHRRKVSVYKIYEI
jgi:hypothetical protein